MKGGIAYGATDEFGFEAVENKVHVHDLHATILHLMGLDHEKLTYFHQGRHERLTDVYGDGGEGHPVLNAWRSGDVSRREARKVNAKTRKQTAAGGNRRLNTV